MWVDGILKLEVLNLDTAQSSTDNMDFALFMSYWNGGVAQDQVQYLDDIVITTDMPPSRDARGNPMIGPSPLTISTTCLPTGDTTAFAWGLAEGSLPFDLTPDNAGSLADPSSIRGLYGAPGDGQHQFQCLPIPEKERRTGQREASRRMKGTRLSPQAVRTPGRLLSNWNCSWSQNFTVKEVLLFHAFMNSSA